MPPSRSLEDDFKARFGRKPEWFSQAPGRVNLIGEHTDYNGGFVLPMAIERRTEIAAAPNGGTTVTLRSTAVDDVACIDLTSDVNPRELGCWSNYARGVLAGFMNAGFSPAGFDALIHTSVPIGGGLSSSASLEVALATLLEEIIGQRLSPIAKIELCRTAEHEYAGVPCGIMDQFVCTLGRENHLMLLDCRSQRPQWIELANADVSILIVQTNVRHDLASGEYANRRAQCETAADILQVHYLREASHETLERRRDLLGDVVYRRARHVLTECARTRRAAVAIREGAWLEVGQLMYTSHDSLRDDYEVSCAELDAVVEIAQNIGPRGGVYGCRMTGGGFGGCAVALIDARQQDRITETIVREYRAQTGIEPMIFASRPAGGASAVSN